MTEPPADERQRSLPGEHPKSPHDDPGAGAAVARIMASDSYREATADPGFLNEELTRGLRLQLEYLKAETLLRQHDIRHTVVVFGSASTAETSPWYEMARGFGRLVGQSGLNRGEGCTCKRSHHGNLSTSVA